MKGNPKGDYSPEGDDTRKESLTKAFNQYEEDDPKGSMVKCPGCGKKFSASNQGGAAVGGGGA